MYTPSTDYGSSLYASADQAQIPKISVPEGMDIYGVAAEDPSSLYSVPVKGVSNKPTHPDGVSKV